MMRRRPYVQSHDYNRQMNVNGSYYIPPYQEQSPYQVPYQQQPPYYPPVPEQPMTPFEQFAKPSQPNNWPAFMPYNQPYYSHPQPQAEPQPQPVPNSFLTLFQDENGQLDFNKTLSNVGQIANTVQQVTPIIQQVGSIIKSFR